MRVERAEPKGRTVARRGSWLLVALYCATVRGQPNEPDAAVTPAARARAQIADAAVAPPTSARVQIAEVLHSVSALSRLRMRCRSSEEKPAEAKPLDRLHCAFAIVSIRPQVPERMATLENYAEILKELRAHCRGARPRSERARLACAACRDDLSDACLYVQAMLALRKDCGKRPRPVPHLNPAVAALEHDAAERGQDGAQLMERFCGACTQDASAQCFSAFWRAIDPPDRCTLTTDAYELELTRQDKTSTWIGNLGGACNTQITLALDERHKIWTYTEIRLTPEGCAAGEAAELAKPAVYSSAARYAFPDLPAMCERITFL